MPSTIPDPTRGERSGEEKTAVVGRRWRLAAMVGGSQKVRPWRAAAMFRELERATKVCMVRLVWRDRGWEAQVVVKVPVRVGAQREETVCGIDVGMRHLLVASIPSANRQWWLGKSEASRLWRELDAAQEARRTLARDGKREAARYKSDKCERLRDHITELASKRLIDWCVRENVTLIRMEKLTGIRRKTDDATWNRRLSHWPWYQLQQRIEQKAAEHSIPVEYVHPAGTSQTCSACGHVDAANRDGAQFKCLACGFERHADLNAANNIARWGETDFDAPTKPTRLRSSGTGHDAGLSGNAVGSVSRLTVRNPEPCAL